MEIILAILGELESLESLVNLAWKKWDGGLKLVNVTKVEGSHALLKISINKKHYSKILHLLVEINNNLVKQLVDTGVSMLVINLE
jgi:predicted aspartyl protease